VAVIIAPITKENSAHDTPILNKPGSPSMCLLPGRVPEIWLEQKPG
jgi:hypothetical protein